MPSLPPTKSTLLRVKKTLKFASEGYDLLERKREFLVMELVHHVNRVKILEKEFLIKTRKLKKLYTSALLSGGLIGLMEKGKRVEYDYEIEVKNHYVMGLALPVVDYLQGENNVPFAGFNAGPALDKLASAFRDLLKTLAELAGVKTSVWHLAREVKKTQRRVNALDKIVIPDNRKLEKYIQNTLEESEREGFFVKKMIRKKKRRR
ncbi:MAG: V-type ATP synthase subunit D [Spirochaetes bacterium]|nr:V-type ATP synthase subunit D [Spirochaetota bacterium]